MAKVTSRTDDNCLVIRSLTPEFSYADRDEMFYGLGATSVHNYPRSTVIFCRSERDCHLVIRLLHQRHFHGRRLRVEFATPKQRQEPLHCHRPPDVALRRKIQEGQLEALTSIRQGFQNSSPPLNFPQATRSIVARITENLLRNPEFYHQVLLLMFKFGFEPPFDSNDSNSDLNPKVDSIPLPSEIEEKEEEELESEPIRFESPTPEVIIQRRKRKRKRLKTGFLGEEEDRVIKRRKSTNQGQRSLTTVIEEVFDEKVEIPNKKELKIIVQPPEKVSLDSKLKPTSKSLKNLDLSESSTSFGTITSLPLNPVKPKSPPPPSLTFDLVSLTPSELFPESKIESNRIASFRWHEFNVFRNYQRGEPGVKLYVKNLDKKVTLRDLYRLYGGFIDLTSRDDLVNFNITYMEKGRMRGQAFITFPTVDSALKALEQTNGFCFYDKPIVVVFARTSKESNTAQLE